MQPCNINYLRNKQIGIRILNQQLSVARPYFAVSLFPKGPFSLLALIKLLSGSSCNQLQALGDNVLFNIDNQKVNMVRGHNIVEYTQTISFFCLKEPVPPSFSVFFKPEQEFLLMTPVGDMPGASRYVVSVCSRHE